ncbi:hypothetical protein T459_12023 [Capsicum annuum]|uniref:Cytochrome b/b6 N-terminal region profile domain-containing protein n=1 Tax=Capsicum annuum TaxID=4072 RepID=A0A2G2ZNL0_CAPAN|nr:hypothetical protein T459_12023 [Capsicum annuum]
MVENEEIYHQYDEWNGNQKHDWGPHGLRSNLVNGAHEEMTLVSEARPHISNHIFILLNRADLNKHLFYFHRWANCEQSEGYDAREPTRMEAKELKSKSEPFTESRETASFSVTGYALSWDQIGYWAVKIVSGVPDAIPIIGSPLVELLHALAEAIVAAPAPIDFSPSNIST